MQLNLFKNLELKTTDGKPERISNLLGSSHQWFSNSDLNSIDFDFFIDWRTESFVPHVFVKKIFNSKEAEEYFQNRFLNNPENLMEALSPQLEKYKILEKYNINIQFLFFNDYEKNPKIYSINNNDMEVISIDKLKELILRYTGKKFRIGSKGLTWATSELERSLSTTDTPYTGDCDLLTFDNNGNILSIFEYQKKHDGNYLFLEELWNKNQKAKFKRLMILRDYLKRQSNQNILLNIIHYSNHKNPIVETIINSKSTVKKEFNRKHFQHSNFLSYLSTNLHLAQNIIFLSSDINKNPDIIYNGHIPEIKENNILLLDDNLKNNANLINQLKGIKFLFMDELVNSDNILFLNSINNSKIESISGKIIIILSDDKNDQKIDLLRKNNNHLLIFREHKLIEKIRLMSANKRTNIRKKQKPK